MKKQLRDNDCTDKSSGISWKQAIEPTTRHLHTLEWRVGNQTSSLASRFGRGKCYACINQAAVL